MKIKFLVDESTGIRVAESLREMSFDTLSVVEDMRGAEDAEIIQRAVREERVIVTNDKDFGRLVFKHRFFPKGVLLLRLHDESAENKIRVIRMVVERYLEEIEGAFMVVTEWKVRRRPVLG